MRWCLSDLPPPNHLCKAVSPSSWSSLPVWLWLRTESRTVQSRMWCHQSWWQFQLKAYLHSRVGISSHSFTWMWDQPLHGHSLHHWIPPHQSFLGRVRLYSVSTSASKTSSSIHPHCHQIWEPHWPAMMLPHSECEQGPLKASYSKAMRKVQCWHNVATICESCQHRSCSCGGEALLGKDSRSGCQRNQSVCMCKYECAHACLLVFACMTIWQIGMDLNSVIYTNYCLSHVILFFCWTLYEHKTGKGVHRQKQERR